MLLILFDMQRRVRSRETQNKDKWKEKAYAMSQTHSQIETPLFRDKS